MPCKATRFLDHSCSVLTNPDAPLPQDTATSLGERAPWDWTGTVHPSYPLVSPQEPDGVSENLMVFLRTGYQSISCVRLFVPGLALGKPNLRLQPEAVCFLLQKRQHAAAPPSSMFPRDSVQQLHPLAVLPRYQGLIICFGFPLLPLCRAPHQRT